MINCRLVLTDEGEQTLLKQMVKILRGLGDQEAVKAVSRRRELPLLRYKVKGGVRWDRDRKAKVYLFGAKGEVKAGGCVEKLNSPEKLCTSELAFFQCPNCQGYTTGSTLWTSTIA